MPFNGSGTFTRLYNWVDDAANGIKIRADRMDAEMDGFATGLTDCVTRDGQSAATADLPMGGFKHTNVDDATDPAHYASAKQVMNDLAYCGTVGGTANAITVDSAIAPTALVAGQRISFFAAADNTDAVTLNRNSLGAKSLLLNGAALTAGQIKSGYLYIAVYDGTQFNLPSTTGLGTAAAKNIGTSGDTVPLCSGSNTFSGLTTFSGTVQLQGTVALSTPLPLAYGGTAATSASSARTSLGVTATGSDTTYCYRANNLSDVTASTARSNLGLGTGATANITVSSSSPSGGNNGDLWFKT